MATLVRKGGFRGASYPMMSGATHALSVQNISLVGDYVIESPEAIHSILAGTRYNRKFSTVISGFRKILRRFDLDFGMQAPQWRRPLQLTLDQRIAQRDRSLLVSQAGQPKGGPKKRADYLVVV